MSNYTDPQVTPVDNLTVLDTEGMIERMWAGDTTIIPTYISVPAVQVTLPEKEWQLMRETYDLLTTAIASSGEVKDAWDNFLYVSLLHGGGAGD